MAIGGAQGGFQLREVLRAEQVVHALPHGVAELGSFGQCLPRTGQIAVPDILHGGVDVFGDILRELLYPEAAVKGCRQQQGYDANADINTFHTAPPCRSSAV